MYGMDVRATNQINVHAKNCQRNECERGCEFICRVEMCMDDLMSYDFHEFLDGEGYELNIQFMSDECICAP